jgi:hypothetical protein
MGREVMSEKEGLRDQRISVLIHVMLGLAIGAASPFLGRALYAIALGIVAVVLVGHVLQRILGNREFSWWLGNGPFIYLFVWLDAWVFIVNYF